MDMTENGYTNLVPSSSSVIAAIINTFHMKLLAEFTHGLLPQVVVCCVCHRS